MRSLARSILGLGGLALLAPAVLAQSPQPVASANPAAHQHKGLLGWRHCVECQRANVLKRDGVNVPPPPSIAQGTVVGQPVHVQGDPSSCAACQAGAGSVIVAEGYPAGHASVGGPMLAGSGAPGYAVVGGDGPMMAGAAPSPVGVSNSQGRWNGPRVAAAGPRPGAAYDPSVLPSSMIPAQTALSKPAAGRPHVIRHLFGLDEIGRGRREAREESSRESHASISYSAGIEPVTELPAKMVYDKKH